MDLATLLKILPWPVALLLFALGKIWIERVQERKAFEAHLFKQIDQLQSSLHQKEQELKEEQKAHLKTFHLLLRGQELKREPSSAPPST